MVDASLPEHPPVVLTGGEWSDIADSLNALFCALHKCIDVDEVERLDLARAAYARLSAVAAPIGERLSDAAHAEGGAQ